MSEHAAADRERVRRAVRAERRALDAHERERRSHRLCVRLARGGALLGARRIAGFWPHDAEVDVSPLFPRLWQAGIRLYLPVVERARLWFAPFRPESRVTDNRFGIPEPVAARRDACSPLALDFVLVPLVAFDHRGNRLGMGGGYYDRTFGYLRHRTALRRPRLIGIGFEFQRRPSFAAREWDVPLDAAVTEAGVYCFSRKYDRKS